MLFEKSNINLSIEACIFEYNSARAVKKKLKWDNKGPRKELSDDQQLFCFFWDLPSMAIPSFLFIIKP